MSCPRLTQNLASQIRTKDMMKKREEIPERAFSHISKVLGFPPNAHFIKSLLKYLGDKHGIAVYREYMRSLKLACLKLDEHFDDFKSDLDSIVVDCSPSKTGGKPSVYKKISINNNENFVIERNGWFKSSKGYARMKKRSDIGLLKKSRQQNLEKIPYQSETLDDKQVMLDMFEYDPCNLTCNYFDLDPLFKM